MACVVKPPGVPVDTPPGRSAGSSASLAGSEAGGSEAATAAAAAAAPAAKAPPPAAPSVYSRLARSLAPSTQLGALRRPRHCHRLDEPTGGELGKKVGGTAGAVREDEVVGIKQGRGLAFLPYAPPHPASL